MIYITVSIFNILLNKYSCITVFLYELQFISLRRQKLCLEMKEIYCFYSGLVKHQINSDHDLAWGYGLQVTAEQIYLPSLTLLYSSRFQ